jgi:hypothetical protein
MAAAEAMRCEHSPDGAHPGLHCRIRMAIKIAVDLPDFFYRVDFIVDHNLKLKTML